MAKGAKSPQSRKSSRRKSAYQNAERAGRWAEWLVLLCYMIRGFWLIAWRKKTPYGEVDLILRRGQHIRFIEVKYRRYLNASDSPLSPHQMRRLRAAAQLCYHRLAPDGRASCQFDMVLVRRWGQVTPFYNHISLS